MLRKLDEYFARYESRIGEKAKMTVYRTNSTRNSPFLSQIVPETIFLLIFNIFSFFHTVSGNRKLLLKPLRKLLAVIAEALSALLNAFLYIYKSKGVDNFGKRRI